MKRYSEPVHLTQQLANTLRTRNSLMVIPICLIVLIFIGSTSLWLHMSFDNKNYHAQHLSVLIIIYHTKENMKKIIIIAIRFMDYYQ